MLTSQNACRVPTGINWRQILFIGNKIHENILKLTYCSRVREEKSLTKKKRKWEYRIESCGTLEVIQE